MSCVQNIRTVGFDPIHLQWKIIRGNTASLKIQFLNNDEVTLWGTMGWNFVSTAYNTVTHTSDELETSFANGFLTITAPSDVTAEWGLQYGSIVGELPFDVQVSFVENNSDIVWTPIVGTICLIGEVTTGSNL